jgi:vacuolar-type H+-ATPase subunit E/Vma4
MDRIFTDIRESVKKEAAQLIDRAQRVAEREKQHAQEEAEQILSANRAGVERELKTREERAGARRFVDARKSALAEREKFVDEVFSRALQRLRDVARDDHYRAWLENLLKRACPEFGTERPVVRCAQRDRELVQQFIASYDADLADDDAAISGGLVLVTPDGRLTVDCSIEAELARAQDELRDQVLAKLELAND